MKKIIFVLLCIFMFVPVVYAAPKRNTRSLDSIKITEVNKNYNPGDRLFLDFKMVTDTSNVENVLLYFRSANYDNYFLSNLQDIKGNSYIEIPKNIESNFYTISRLIINYKDGNSTEYSSTGIEPLSTKYDFGNEYILIGNAESDLSQKISSVKFSSESIVSGGSISLSVTLDSEIDLDQTNTYAVITDGINVIKFNLNGSKTNNLTGNVVVTGLENTYYLDSITITDKKNNSKTIYYKNEGLSNKKTFCNDNLECIDEIVSFKLENNVEETDTPVLRTIKFNKKSTSDNAKIFVDATDSGSGINNIAVTLYKISDDGTIDLESKITTNLYYDVFLEEYVGMINFRNKPVGKYYVFKTELTDNLNATKQVCLNECDTETLVNMNSNKYDSIEYIEGTNEVLEIDDEELIEKIKDAKDENIIIDISNNKIISKEIFATVQNTNKTLVFKDNGIEWIFKGNDIEKIKEVELSFNTSVYSNKEIGKEFIALELSNKGSLPGKVKVRINSLYTYQYEKNNDKVNVYYVNGEKYSEIVNIISVTDDGYYEFEIAQTGTYLLSNQRISDSLIVKDDDINEDINNDNRRTKTKKNYDNLIVFIIVAIPLSLLLIVIVIYCVRTVRMRRNSLENYVVDDPIIATPLEEDEKDLEQDEVMKYKSKENK